MKADKRSKTSAENGKLGGRPISTTTLITQESRKYIAEQVRANLEGIVSQMLAKSLDGDLPATRELFDRAFGKAVQAVVTENEDGERLSIVLAAELAKRNDNTA